MGYCLCPVEKDEFNTECAALRSGREVKMACGEGYSGELTRQCSFFGDWIKVSGECVRNRCPAEEQSAVMWSATDSMETASCVSGLGAGFACVCGADGVWGEVTGECWCGATTMDEVEYPASAAGTVIHLECPAGFTGSFERRCNGKIERNCVRITCPEESFEGVMWRATEGGLTGVHSCGEDEEGGLRRVCREKGEWSSVVSGEGCYCQATVVEERGTYIFARTEPLATVVEACATMYAGTIRYTCSLGGSWTDLVNECERITCPGEMMEGLFFPTTESTTTRVLPCEEGVVGSGYARVCDENGVWSECSCPAEVVHHSDGNVYLMEEVVSAMCGANMTGYVWRSWSTVRRVVCDPRRVQAHSVSGGAAERLHVAGDEQFDGGACAVQRVHAGLRVAQVRSEPEDSCRTQMCEPVTMNRMSNGCMNLKFEPEVAMPCVRVNVVPSSSPDLSMVFRGRTVRICGLEVKVAYWMFVEYCTDESTREC